MKDYNEIAREVLRRRDERLAAAAKKRAAVVKTASTIACFCIIAFSAVVAVKLDYINKSVVESVDSNFNTVDPENGDDPISAYVTDEKDTTDSDSISDTTTDPVSSDPQSESDDTTTDPITVILPDTEPEPPVTDTPGTSEPPSTKPEPPETTDPPTSDTDPPETTPGTSEPPSTKPEPPVTDPPVTDPPVTDPPVTEDTGIFDPPDTDMWPTDTAPEPNDTTPAPPVTDPPRPPSRPEDPYPPDFWDPPFSGGFTDVGEGGGSLASVDYITKADLFYILYFNYSYDFVTEEPIFEDVPMGRWYSESITWAVKKGFVYSVPSNNGPYLDPFDYVKRQDLACYLYALAGSPDVIGSIEDYTDFEKVEEYAVTAMAWCIENGILTDIGGKLSPLSKVTLSNFKIIFDKFLYIR